MRNDGQLETRTAGSANDTAHNAFWNGTQQQTRTVGSANDTTHNALRHGTIMEQCNGSGRYQASYGTNGTGWNANERGASGAGPTTGSTFSNNDPPDAAHPPPPTLFWSSGGYFDPAAGHRARRRGRSRLTHGVPPNSVRTPMLLLCLGYESKHEMDLPHRPTADGIGTLLSSTVDDDSASGTAPSNSEVCVGTLGPSTVDEASASGGSDIEHAPLRCHKWHPARRHRNAHQHSLMDRLGEVMMQGQGLIALWYYHPWRQPAIMTAHIRSAAVEATRKEHPPTIAFSALGTREEATAGPRPTAGLSILGTPSRKTGSMVTTANSVAKGADRRRRESWARPPSSGIWPVICPKPHYTNGNGTSPFCNKCYEFNCRGTSFVHAACRYLMAVVHL